MTPNSIFKTVKIPITILNNAVCLTTGGHLPAFKHGTIGELIVSADAFVDAKLAEQFTHEKTESFLTTGTELVAEITIGHVPETLKAAVVMNLPGVYGPCVRFTLSEDQQIQRRGTKFAQLRPCKCRIPSLNQVAISINHAYTLISQAYELDRKSHTGNVFSKVFYYDGHMWHQLEHLRGY